MALGRPDFMDLLQPRMHQRFHFMDVVVPRPCRIRSDGASLTSGEGPAIRHWDGPATFSDA